jgi:hypothetical protein
MHSSEGLVFRGEDTIISALEQGRIAASAHGTMVNKLVAERSNGEFEVVAIYSLEGKGGTAKTVLEAEYAALCVKIVNTALLAELNTLFGYFTDHRKIDYPDWQKERDIL